MKEPKLRFPEFTDDWEQRKLGSILTRRIEHKKQSKEYPRLAFASGQGVIPLSERKTNNREQLIKDEFTKKYLVTELNDIVYNPGNLKYGAIDRNKCQRGLISPIYVTFTVNEVPGFIERIVTSHNFQQRALRFEEGTVVKRQSVNPEDLINLDIFIAPQKEEQTKISECFDVLDILIQSAEKELEGYKELKQGMLQKMFPKTGETVPEIRFPEFTGDWEEHELSEMYNYEQPSKYIVKNDDYEGCSKYPVLTANKGFILGYTDETEGIYDKGEVIIFDDFTCDHKFVNFPFKVKSSAIKFLTPKDNYNLSFLSELLSVMNQQPLSHQRHWISVMQPSIALIPSLEEQKKIGEYFSNLDNLITLQQKEIDGYKELKKGLLQQMFC